MKNIKDKYLDNGLDTFELEKLNDFLVIHDVDVKQIKGIDKLSQNRAMFEKFIINFYNAQGLEAREKIKPVSVKLVKNRTEAYLRFDYKRNGKKEWMQVKGENTWY